MYNFVFLISNKMIAPHYTVYLIADVKYLEQFISHKIAFTLTSDALISFQLSL